MHKIIVLHRAGLYETLCFTRHTITFTDRYNLTVLTNLYKHAKEVLNYQ